jgi:GTP cyclohydrolase I/GTP cyclohydrolase-4
MVRGVIETYPEIADPAFVSARQVNLETIHQHNVVAERFGTFGEIRRELESGVPSPVQTSRRAWLDAVP